MSESEWNQSVDLRRESDFQDGEALEAVQPTPVLDQLAQQVDRLASTEDILKRAIEAAEHNQITEKVLERRNEVKDFAAIANERAQYTARLGDILSTNQTVAHLGATNAGQHEGHNRLTMNKLFSSSTLYGQAVKYGFVTAVCALIVAILLVTLFT